MSIKPPGNEKGIYTIMSGKDYPRRCNFVLNKMKLIEDIGYQPVIVTESDIKDTENKNKVKQTKEEELDEDEEEVLPEDVVFEADSIVIDNNSVSRKPWSQVNKSALKAKLKKALDEGIPGAKAAINECFGIVRGYDAPSEQWKYPHHELIGNRLVLNINGLRAAIQMVGLGDMSASEKARLLRHLNKHAKKYLKKDDDKQD